jgi:hypothetical protein
VHVAALGSLCSLLYVGIRKQSVVDRTKNFRSGVFFLLGIARNFGVGLRRP